MPSATTTQSTSTTIPTFRVPLTAPYPPNSYATVSYTDHATMYSIRVEDAPAPYLTAELPQHPQNSDYTVTLTLTAQIYDLVEIAQDIATRRNELIAALNTDPVAALDNPRHNYFQLFREMREKYPNATAGDVHQALKIAQQLPDMPQPAKPENAEPIPVITDAQLEHARTIAKAYAGSRMSELAEDIAQDVALEVWKTYDKFDPARCTFEGWVKVITKAHTAKAFRRQRTEDYFLGETDSLDVYIEPSDNGPTFDFDVSDSDAAIVESIRAGYTVTETASRLNRTRKAIRYRLDRMGKD